MTFIFSVLCSVQFCRSDYFRCAPLMSTGTANIAFLPESILYVSCNRCRYVCVKSEIKHAPLMSSGTASRRRTSSRGLAPTAAPPGAAPDLLQHRRCSGHLQTCLRMPSNVITSTHKNMISWPGAHCCPTERRAGSALISALNLRPAQRFNQQIDMNAGWHRLLPHRAVRRVCSGIGEVSAAGTYMTSVFAHSSRQHDLSAVQRRLLTNQAAQRIRFGIGAVSSACTVISNSTSS